MHVLPTVSKLFQIDIHSPDDITFSNFDKQVINGNEGHIRFGSEFELRLKVFLF